VAGGAVAAAGLLDAVAADVLLAEQEWDIACTLYRQARLRALHHQTTRDTGQATRQVEASQLAALGESVAAVTRRVEALEKYARHIADADAAYRDWRQSIELAGRNEDH
jgi:CheY-like chemotaxis protein